MTKKSFENSTIRKIISPEPPEAASVADLNTNESGDLIIEGLRQNNLKNLNIRIKHNSITAIVGLSGSGKSSLAFDTLFAEGRWRFMESLSTYTRLFLERMDRPDLDAIRNIRPAIAVEQTNPVRGSRSTVGTTTEINDYLRLLFARIGTLHCPKCGNPVHQTSPALIAANIHSTHFGETVLIGFDLKTENLTPAEVSANLIKKGFMRVLIDGKIVNIAEEALHETLPALLPVIVDRVVIKDENRNRLGQALEVAFKEGGPWALINNKRKGFSKDLRCQTCDILLERPTPVSLSFNHPVGACHECKGFGNILHFDIDKIIPDKDLTLAEGAIEPWTKPAYKWWYHELEKHAAKAGIDLDLPFSLLPDKATKAVFEGTPDFDGINGFFAYLETKKYKLHIKVFISRYKGQVKCHACDGTRLTQNAKHVRVGGINITEACVMSINECAAFFDALKLSPYESEVAKEILKQLKVKLDHLVKTGLGYITLDRLTKTLSGGEAQRVQLSRQLAAMLCGVLYILDEPSIGLHPIDVDMLVTQIKKLSELGNTVVIVEHDPTVIKAADNIIELGPGAGDKGGRCVYNGSAKDYFSQSKTITADYLTGRAFIHTPRWRRKGSSAHITLTGATGNNLKSVDIKIPLRSMTCVSGVSGSGKSTLIIDTLYNALSARFKSKTKSSAQAKALPYKSLDGSGHITGVKLIDQSPIGRTPRSVPLTYIGGFDDIRSIYANLTAAKGANLSPGHFSFNAQGGRCEACKGEGAQMLEMYFLPDVYVKCPSCNGKRFKQNVLNVKYRGKSIYDCLEMTFDEAAYLFQGNDALQKKFTLIRHVGLGYLKLGQSALTLSGGEAQRLKIARELATDETTDMLYILDEPTTGLHMEDTKKLLSTLNRLIDAGNTVVVIEHNIEWLKTADHLIDLGPSGGPDGGRVVAHGTPEHVAKVKESATGRYLKGLLAG